MISGSSQMGFTVPWVSLFLHERWSLTSGSSQMGFTVPWVSLFLEERWSLTSGGLSHGFYCAMGVIIFRREVVSDIR